MAALGSVRRPLLLALALLASSCGDSGDSAASEVAPDGAGAGASGGASGAGGKASGGSGGAGPGGAAGGSAGAGEMAGASGSGGSGGGGAGGGGAGAGAGGALPGGNGGGGGSAGQVAGGQGGQGGEAGGGGAAGAMPGGSSGGSQGGAAGAAGAGGEGGQGGGAAGAAGVGGVDPVAVFGSKYWNVYRPYFLAQHYEQGRVTDRIELGQKMFGDNNIFMGYALSTFVFEYEAAKLPESLGYIHEILDAYAALDVLDGDPLDGYVYRTDRGPDYLTNPITHDNEPSGDQYLGTLRGLFDVVTSPESLVHAGVDLKDLARQRALWLGTRLKLNKMRIRNQLGQLVKRGDDQRWASWCFEQGASRVASVPSSVLETSWDLNGLSVGPSAHEAISMQFVQGCFDFSVACQSGKQISVLGVPVSVSCNEFNINLGGDAAVISLSEDPASPRWFSAWVKPSWLVEEGHAMYAMYARYKFGDKNPALLDPIGRFLTAPATPPTGDNKDPNGWCRSFRWAHDFADPQICVTDPHAGAAYSGIDYMLPRAFASAHGELPEP